MIMNSSSLDLHAALDTVEAIARQAGAILREHFERPREAEHKNTRIDLVTAADRASEAYIVKALLEAFPNHHIHGEEGGGCGAAPEVTPYHWYVDPLDGTTNFAHRFPVFAVSIALSNPDLRPILGVVYDPTRDECFKGIRGQGATLSGQPLHVSSTENLGQALAATGFPYDSWTNPDNNVAEVGFFIVRTQGVRRAGSAALDLCYVAAGRFDLYWEHGAKPWDVQAGILFVEEAGGRVSDYHGQPNGDAYSGRMILATNGYLHDQAVAVLAQGDAAPRPAAH
jgi:myo-inositol-1(or 4)-monophosphatase